MIATLLLAGQRLSGRSDARITRGLWWSVGESLCAAAPFVLACLLLRDVLDGSVTTGSTFAYAGAMLAVLVARALCAARALPAIFSGAYATMAEARLRIADHLRRLPIGWFATQRSGGLAATLSTDLQLVEDLWAHFLGMFFGGLLVPLLLCVALFWLDWRLALVVIASLPLACGALLLAVGLIGRQAGLLHEANAQGQADMLDYVQGIAVIRAFEQEGAQGRMFTRLAEALKAMKRRALVIELWPAPLVALFGFAAEMGFALAAWFGAQRLDVSLDGNTLLLFTVLSLPIYRQLFDVGLSFMLLRYAQQAMERIEGLLAQPVMAEPASPCIPTSFDIQLDNLGFAYAPGEPPALSGLTAHLPAGSFTAIVGRSGAGKTTLAHLIARLRDADQGAVRIGGVDVRDIGSEALHRQIGLVFQDVMLVTGSVRDNLLIGKPDATQAEIEHAARLARAHQFITALPQGYDTPIGEDGARLSGGERQRLSIARVLLKDPPILLLDEATASMDATNAAAIQHAFSAAATGRTVLAIAHRLHSIRHADRILVLDQGRLAEMGTHDELIARHGLYDRLWRHQVNASAWRLGDGSP